MARRGEPIMFRLAGDTRPLTTGDLGAGRVGALNGDFKAEIKQ